LVYSLEGVTAIQFDFRATKVTAIVVVSLVVAGAVFYAILNSFQSSFATDEHPIAFSQQFEIDDLTNTSLSNETVKLYTHGDNWKTTQYNLQFSDYEERARRASEQAERNRIALNQQAYLSQLQAQQNASGGGSAPAGPAPLAPGNRYVAGTCTWYAYNRRFQLGRPVGSFWGNGGNWHNSAAAAGVRADHTPEVGAVFEQAGHVGVVEQVGDNNTVFISEMNYGGLYRYNTRWIANASGYWYIH
jgi:surface antigen